MRLKQHREDVKEIKECYQWRTSAQIAARYQRLIRAFEYLEYFIWPDGFEDKLIKRVIRDADVHKS